MDDAVAATDVSWRRRQTANRLAVDLAAAHAGADIRVEPGLEQPLRTLLTRPAELVGDILDIADADEPTSVVAYRTSTGRMSALVVHGQVWSLVIRPDQVPDGYPTADRSATTWLLLDAYPDEDGQPLCWCPDGDEDVDWTRLVAEVLMRLDPPPDQHPGRRYRPRGGHRPGRTPRQPAPPSGVPNWAGQRR